jgi:hypothetical protein
VESAADADPEVAARAALFRRTARIAREALTAELDAPVPAALEAAVRAIAARHGAGTHGAGGPAAARILAAPRRWNFGALFTAANAPAFAVAASVVAAVAGVIGWSAGHHPEPGLVAGQPIETRAIAAALDTVRSGENTALPGIERLELVATFRDGHGALCREFRMEATTTASDAVACRDGNRWVVRMVQAEPVAVTGYAPASGAAVMDAWLSAHGAGDPLDPEAESAALAAQR